MFNPAEDVLDMQVLLNVMKNQSSPHPNVPEQDMRPSLEVNATISAVPKIFVWHFGSLFSWGVGTAGLG